MADALTPQLALTTVAEPKDCDGKRLYPVNVGWGGVSYTITTKYKDMNADSLGGHRWGFQRTAILIEYE